MVTVTTCRRFYCDEVINTATGVELVYGNYFEICDSTTYGGGGGGGSAGSGDSGNNGNEGLQTENPLCAKLRALGLSGKDLKLMQTAYGQMMTPLADRPNAMHEAGYRMQSNGNPIWGTPNLDSEVRTDFGGTYIKQLKYPSVHNANYSYFFHTHFVAPPIDRQRFPYDIASGNDMSNARALNGANSYIGHAERLFYVNNSTGNNGITLGGSEWLTASCD